MNKARARWEDLKFNLRNLFTVRPELVPWLQIKLDPWMKKIFGSRKEEDGNVTVWDFFKFILLVIIGIWIFVVGGFLYIVFKIIDKLLPG